MFNFRPSVRPVPLQVHINGFPGKHYCPRMATMNKPTFGAIRTHSPDKPTLIFVSSRRQTRLTALDLIAYLAAENDPKQWLHMPEEEVIMKYLTLPHFTSPFHLIFTSSHLFSPFHLTFSHLTSPFHLTFPSLPSPHLFSPCVTFSPHLPLSHLFSPSLPSSHLPFLHLTLPHFTSPFHLTFPHLISPFLSSLFLSGVYFTSPNFLQCLSISRSYCYNFVLDCKPYLWFKRRKSSSHFVFWHRYSSRRVT